MLHDALWTDPCWQIHHCPLLASSSIKRGLREASGARGERRKLVLVSPPSWRRARSLPLLRGSHPGHLRARARTGTRANLLWTSPLAFGPWLAPGAPDCPDRPMRCGGASKLARVFFSQMSSQPLREPLLQSSCLARKLSGALQLQPQLNSRTLPLCLRCPPSPSPPSPSSLHH